MKDDDPVRKALSDLLWLIDEGVLVFNRERFPELGWGVRAIGVVRTVKRARQALTALSLEETP